MTTGHTTRDILRLSLSLSLPGFLTTQPFGHVRVYIAQSRDKEQHSHDPDRGGSLKIPYDAHVELARE